MQADLQFDVEIAESLLKILTNLDYSQSLSTSADLNQAFSEIKLELCLLSLKYKDGSPSKQRKLDDLAEQILKNNQTQFEDKTNVENITGKFQKLLKFEVDKLTEFENTVNPGESSSLHPDLSTNWIGSRISAEIPLTKKDITEDNLQKDLSAEMINEKFMFVEDYFHYKDWEEKLRREYDSLNLMINPKLNDLLFYSRNSKASMARFPTGIFPDPKGKRKPSSQFVKAISTKSELRGAINQPLNAKSKDKYALFLKNPEQFILERELEKGKWKEEVNSEIEMIVNLQNIKNGLKKECSVKEIVNKVLSMEFIEILAQEHLNKLKDPSNTKELTQDDPIYISRNPGLPPYF
jgi:hypothetical protein